MQGEDVEGRTGMRDASSDAGGRHPRGAGVGASARTARKEHSRPESSLMEAVVGRENMVAALRRVEANKGAPGVDKRPVGGLRPPGIRLRIARRVTSALAE